jgi:hypothetical protein
MTCFLDFDIKPMDILRPAYGAWARFPTLPRLWCTLRPRCISRVRHSQSLETRTLAAWHEVQVTFLWETEKPGLGSFQHTFQKFRRKPWTTVGDSAFRVADRPGGSTQEAFPGLALKVPTVTLSDLFQRSFKRRRVVAVCPPAATRPRVVLDTPSRR